MPKVYIARDPKTGKFLKAGDNRHCYGTIKAIRSDRPTFYKTSAALYSSLGRPVPKAVKTLAKADGDNSWGCFDFIKKQKLDANDLLTMLQAEGKIQVFEVDEQKMLGDYLQTTFQIQIK